MLPIQNLAFFSFILSGWNRGNKYYDTCSWGISWRGSPWTSWGCWSSLPPQGTPHTGRQPGCFDKFVWKVVVCSSTTQRSSTRLYLRNVSFTVIFFWIKCWSFVHICDAQAWPIWHTGFEGCQFLSDQIVPWKPRLGGAQRWVTGPSGFNDACMQLKLGTHASNN